MPEPGGALSFMASFLSLRLTVGVPVWLLLEKWLVVHKGLVFSGARKSICEGYANLY